MLIYAGSMSAVYSHNELKKVHIPKLEQQPAPEISPPLSASQPPPLLEPAVEPVQPLVS